MRKKRKHSTRRSSRRRGSRRNGLIDTRHIEAVILKVFENHAAGTLRVDDIYKGIEQLETEKAVPVTDKEVLHSAIRNLVKRGVLRRGRKKRLILTGRDQSLVRGKISIASGGFGFVRPEAGNEDLFINPDNLHGAHHGDTVEAIRTGYGPLGRERGRIVRVIERNETPIVGRYFMRHSSGGVVIPDDTHFPGPVHVRKKDAGEAVDRDRVQVEITDHGSRNGEIRGKVVRVFGPEDDPVARFRALIVQHKFHEYFSRETLREAELLDGKIPDSEMSIRQDLRDRLVITIDPETAQDFDDAISLRKLRGDKYELGVHIADVSWYVRPGGEIDNEALLRGTSVYTSHGTLPMLPERLSNDLCSLREGEDKRTVSVFMEVTSAGEVSGYSLVRSVIRSRKRFTYEEVQNEINRLDDRYEGRLPTWKSGRMHVMLLHLTSLTRSMRRLRLENGGIDLDVPEYEVTLDEDDRADGIRMRTVLESNHLVEECMLAANRSVTEYAVRDRGPGFKAYVFRIHDRPNPDRLEEFAMFVQALGLDWPFGANYETLSARQLDRWLASLENHPLIDLVRIHTLRSLAKAEYNTDNIGHYGLGFSNYTHFTSPIRRYPDLAVHRILLSHLEGRAKHDSDVQQKLKRIAEQSSEREKAALEMERASLKARQAEYFARHIGHEYDGLVTSVIPRGVFVEIAETGASGMILAGNLGTVSFDRRINAFIDAIDGTTWNPGKRIRVKVENADPASGHIDLEPV